MSEELKKGDRVSWLSHSGGYCCTQVGTFVSEIPRGESAEEAARLYVKEMGIRLQPRLRASNRSLVLRALVAMDVTSDRALCQHFYAPLFSKVKKVG